MSVITAPSRVITDRPQARTAPPRTAVETVISRLTEQLVRDSIEQLPPRCRQMITLLFFEQPPQPYNEVAEKLGLARGSIGFIRGRCLKRLKRILQDKGF